MKTLAISCAALLFSLSAQASTHSQDRVQQSLAEHQNVIADYAAKRAKPMPDIQDYRYDMKLDIAKVVRQSKDPWTCNVIPRLMTFEDSQGRLRTIRYSVQSQCINNK